MCSVCIAINFHFSLFSKTLRLRACKTPLASLVAIASRWRHLRRLRAALCAGPRKLSQAEQVEKQVVQSTRDSTESLPSAQRGKFPDLCPWYITENPHEILKSPREIRNHWSVSWKPTKSLHVFWNPWNPVKSLTKSEIQWNPVKSSEISDEIWNHARNLEIFRLFRRFRNLVRFQSKWQTPRKWRYVAGVITV